MRARPDGTPAMRRHRTGRVIGGVASGLADHLSVKVLWVRAAFALLAAASAGAALVAYAMFWVFVPQETITAAEHRSSPKERQQAFGLIALGISLVVARGTLSGTVSTMVAVPVGVALCGAAVVWQEADAAQRRRWVRGARSGVSGAVLGGGGRSALVRVTTGVLLVLVGIGVVLLRSTTFGQLQIALGAVLATLVGVAVLTVPWWLRLVQDLGQERRARIRTEERAEIAAHLHDSVLQTLALIQKQPDVSREVLRLARGQERQLRGWLYGPDGYGDTRDTPGPTTLSQAVAEACGDVEDTFAIAV
ncbi:MAG TPA: PspC domain-containing protein, partial [Pseudonocardiaceae bacterium]